MTNPTDIDEPSVTFEGEFVPPPIGISGRLMPIAGPGHIDIDDEQYHLKAFKMKRSRIVVFVLAFCFFVGSTPFVMLAIGFDPNSWLFYPITLGIIYGAMSLITRVLPDAHRKNSPVSLTIPTDSIRNVRVDERKLLYSGQRIRITTDGIEKRGYGGKREVYFEPSGDFSEVIDALESVASR